MFAVWKILTDFVHSIVLSFSFIFGGFSYIKEKCLKVSQKLVGKLLVLKSNVTNGVPDFENCLVKGKIPSPLTDTPYHVLICTSLVTSNDFFYS